MKIAVIDYGLGNLASVCQGLRAVGLEAALTGSADEILSSRAVILPGVGAFAKGMENLSRLGLIPVLKEVAECGIPLLGICLGMQLLFEESEEHGVHQGLGLLPGRIRRFPPGLKVPHMGWNNLELVNPGQILANIPDQSYVYFVHSYHASDCRSEHIAAITNYGIDFPSAVSTGRILGMQFHPEKSSRVGLQILKNFGELVKKC